MSANFTPTQTVGSRVGKINPESRGNALQQLSVGPQAPAGSPLACTLKEPTAIFEPDSGMMAGRRTHPPSQRNRNVRDEVRDVVKVLAGLAAFNEHVLLRKVAAVQSPMHRAHDIMSVHQRRYRRCGRHRRDAELVVLVAADHQIPFGDPRKMHIASHYTRDLSDRFRDDADDSVRQIVRSVEW